MSKKQKFSIEVQKGPIECDIRISKMKTHTQKVAEREKELLDLRDGMTNHLMIPKQ